MKFNEFVNSKKSVLIIDDCPVYRTALKGMLVKMGFHNDNVLFAADANSALQIARTKELKLVFFDYNLGDSKNGIQLLDELKSSKLLPPSCVLVVVTGDSSKGVVTGFAEQDPDGYLIKPLNYVTLADRLPRFTRRKRELEPLLKMYTAREYELVIETAKQYDSTNPELMQWCQYLSAKSYLKMGDADVGVSLLKSLLGSTLHTKALGVLLRYAIQHQHYDEAQSLISELEGFPFQKPKAMQYAAEIALRQDNKPKALAIINEAVKLAPSSIEQVGTQFQIACASGDFETGLQSINRVIRLTRDSFREHIDLYFSKGSMLLDAAEQEFDIKERSNYINQLLKLAITWRSKFLKKYYIGAELLLFARAHALLGRYEKANQSLEEYEQWLAESAAGKSGSQLEQIEYARVLHRLRGELSLVKMLKQFETIPVAKMDIRTLCVKQYYGAWYGQFSAKTKLVAQLKDHALADFAKQQFEPGVKRLSKAFEVGLYDLSIAELLLKNLSKAWPQEWDKHTVSSLVAKCKTLLQDNRSLINTDISSEMTVLNRQLQLAS
ncbi:response regulator [Shewanella maritima]|nr:response regulator [Shewanella maritima]